MRVGRSSIYFLTILLLGSIILGSGCTDNGSGESRVVKSGDTVQVNYIGKFENGTVFDTSIKETAQKAGIYNEKRNYSPLTFTVGTGQMISGFDEAVIGMKAGEEKTVTLPPEKAYGEYNESLVQAIPLSKLGLSEPPKVGQTIPSPYGQIKVVNVNETHATLDFNSEFAGKTLVFDIKLLSIGENK